MTHYVYILIPDNKEFLNWLYTGYTPNPKRRLKRHSNGEVRSTKARRPYRMVIVKEFDSKAEAVVYERRLKRSSSAKKRIIKDKL